MLNFESWIQFGKTKQTKGIWGLIKVKFPGNCLVGKCKNSRESRNKLSPQGCVPAGNNFQNMFRNLGPGLSEPDRKGQDQPLVLPAQPPLLSCLRGPCLLPGPGPPGPIPTIASRANCPGTMSHHATSLSLKADLIVTLTGLKHVLSNRQNLLSSLYTRHLNVK